MSAPALPRTVVPSSPEPVPRRHWVLLFAGLVFLLLFRIGTRGLNEPDEGRYAQIALDMVTDGPSWWEPRMSDFGHYDKPPLVYWITAVAFRLGGVNEVAARVAPLLGACLALAGVGWAAFRLYGERVAFWTVLFTGTMGQFWLLARFLTPDMLLTGFTTVAVALMIECRHRDGAWRWWALSLAAWALAWWTKATPALIPLLGLTLWTVASADARARRSLRPVRLLLGTLILGSPWFLVMVREHPGLKDFFLGRELVGRVAGHPDGRHGPVYLHLLVSLLGWMPWWPGLLVGMVVLLRRRGWRGAGMPHSLRRWPLEAWIVVTGLAVFSLISSKLPTYTLPMAPWAGLLCARGWLLLAREGIWMRPGRAWIGLAAGMACLFVAAAVSEPWLEDRLGRNSSVRPVVEALRKANAGRVYSDRYWPGLEVYFGESVYYVTDRPPRERADDSGICPTLHESHFVDTGDWVRHAERHPEGSVWLLSYKGRSESPLANPGNGHAIDRTNRVGDFVLYHLAGTPVGGDAPLPSVGLP